MDTDELCYLVHKLDKEIAELRKIGVTDAHLEARRDQLFQKLRECWYQAPPEDDLASE
jgi:hypothetical protein